MSIYETYSDTLMQFAVRNPPRTILDHSEGVARAVDGNRQTGGSTSLLLLTCIHHKVVANLNKTSHTDITFIASFSRCTALFPGLLCLQLLILQAINTGGVGERLETRVLLMHALQGPI